MLSFGNGMMKLLLYNTDLCWLKEGGRMENYEGPNAIQAFGKAKR